MSKGKIRIAVFPVAGRGTRFFPVTKVSPKEMLPIVDKPLIQYAVEEAIAAGAKKLIFITGNSQDVLKSHFENNLELEKALIQSGKESLLSLVKEIIPSDIKCVYINQKKPLGLGHAVLCAQEAVGNEPFFVHLADDLISGDVPCLVQMRSHFDMHKVSIVGVEHIDLSESEKYGIVGTEKNNGVLQVTKIIEKPLPKDAPSNLAVVGRYILKPEIFSKLAKTSKGVGNEIQLTDGISSLIQEQPVHALPFDGIRYDCGSKLGYLRATIEYGIKHPDVGSRLSEYIQRLK